MTLPAVPGWITLDGFVLLIDLVLIQFVSTKRVKTAQDKAFLRLLVVVVALLAADFMGRIRQIAPGVPLWVERLGTYVSYVGDPLGYLFTLSYIDAWVTPSREAGDIRNVFVGVFVVYAVLNALVVTVSDLAGLGWFYYWQGDLYCHGPLYVARGVCNMGLCLVVGLYALVRRKDIRERYRTVILVFPLIVLVSGMLQVAVGGAAYEYAGTILGCLLLYLHLQDHNMDVDALTGLLNRRGVDREMAARSGMEGMGREHGEHAFACCIIDLDHFKVINDRYGHEVGDDALRLFARLMTEAFDQTYQVGRFGGDEFIVISASTVAVTTGIRICRDRMAQCVQYLHELCERENLSGEHIYKLDFSTGVEVYDPSRYEDVEAFIAHVDELMYAEKAEHHALRQD